MQSPGIAETLLAGSKGSSKTSLAVQFMVDRALWVIRHFNVKPSADPIVIGFIGRKFAVDFERTTLETWRRLIPPDLYEIVGGNTGIVIAGAVRLDCGGIAKCGEGRGKHNRFHGASYTIACVDQAEEITADEAGQLRATMNRPMAGLGGVTVPGKLIWIANPPYGWLRPDFVTGLKPGYAFEKFVPEDNPWLDPSYLTTLERAYGHNRPLYDAYRYGVDNIGAVNCVIQPAWIDQALTRSFPRVNQRFLAVDPAWEGDDDTVVFEMNGTDILDVVVWGGTTQPESERRIHVLAQQKGKLPIAIDSTGTCGGIAEHLREMGNTVIFVNFSDASTDPKLLNRRAEMWWNAGQEFQRGQIALSQCPPRLREELCQVGIEVVNGRIKIEDKAKVKARLGRSPDYADAYVIGLWARQFVPDVGRRDERRRSRADEPVSAMAM
jgi:hypothetical protein